MSIRQRPLLTFLLILVVSVSGPGGGAAARHDGPRQDGAEMVICGEDGPRTLLVDARGDPVGADGEPSCCEGPCGACIGSPDSVATPAAAAFVAAGPKAPGTATRLRTPRAIRCGVPQARAPPEDRS